LGDLVRSAPQAAFSNSTFLLTYENGSSGILLNRLLIVLFHTLLFAFSDVLLPKVYKIYKNIDKTD
ncbi:hypothetical protein, partial [Enterococcus faecium]|uniref:hypothetical protein n=1 Tax=Enterococcus faecium TaxID=1352 RepID=UPI001E2D53CA